MNLGLQVLKHTIEREGKIDLIAHGNSMMPVFCEGDRVKISKSSNYQIGDIIAYYLFAGGKLKIIIHRIVFVRKTYVLARGDNNAFIDPIKILYTMIIGKVTGESNGEFK